MENSPTVHTYKNIHVHKARTLTKKPESWNDSAEIKHTDENFFSVIYFSTGKTMIQLFLNRRQRKAITKVK